jgi:hypothetical protein
MRNSTIRSPLRKAPVDTPQAPRAPGGASAPLVVRDADDLSALARSGRLYSPQPLSLELPALPAAATIALAERLDRDRHECGCSLGAKCMAAGAFAALAALAVRYGPLTPAFFWRLPLALAAAVAAAGAGKTLGILAARHRVRRSIARLYGGAHPS